MISLIKSIGRTQERWVEEGARRELDVRHENVRKTRDLKAKDKAKREPGNQEEEEDKRIVIISFPNLIYIIYSWK